MKKLFGFVLMTFFAFSVLPAQDMEDEDESSIGKPSVSVENEFVISGNKLSGKDNKGNFVFDKEGIENTTVATFAVGFDLFEGFTLKPYIQELVSVVGAEKIAVGTFNANNFTIGLGMKYRPMDMLTVSFGAGYVSKWSAEELVKGTSLGNGVKLNVGLGLNVPSIFFEAGVSYRFNGMFATAKEGDNSNKMSDLINDIGLTAQFDFFNFIKEGLDSGLLLSNKTTIRSKTSQDKASIFDGSFKKLSNDFGIGLHFGMVKYMDFSFLVKTGYSSVQKYKDGKYGDAVKTTTVALSLGLGFEKDIFSFGIEYNPQLMVKGNDGKAKEELGHELVVALGISL